MTRYQVLRAGTASEQIGYLCSEPPAPAWNGNYIGVEPANHDWHPVPGNDAHSRGPSQWYCSRCRRVEVALPEPRDASQ